ncbi:MAG: hypothetical protein LCH91_13905 [Bacteroidetes bacterium]|nr:hypothetical protein [Bacteroidota bacterium]
MKSKLKFSILFFLLAFCFDITAQLRQQIDEQIDTLLPSNTTQKITALRIRQAIKLVSNYADPNNLPAQSIGLSKIAAGSATTGQVLKWNGTAWGPSADATGGPPTWGGISGTLASQTDLSSALSGKEPTITVGTTAQYWRGDKTFQTLDKSAVGLSNVDNTSDANKPISTATQTALNGKANNSHTHGAADLTQSGATTGQVLKWTGTAWVPSADATGSAPTWGGISGTLASQTDLSSALSGKEPTITVGTTAQYWRGDKTFQTLDKSAIGLSNVDNTSDANKPISTATQTALNGKANSSHTHGAADLTQSGATTGQVLKWTGTAWVPSADATGSAPTWGGISGTLASQTDLSSALSGKEPSISAGTTAQYWRGDKTFQTLDKSAVGLSNVDNTSDANKPISTATQTALNGKANSSHTHGAADLTQSGATTGQVLKWTGTAWVPSADATGSAPTWGGISGTLASQTDLKSAIAGGFVLPEHFGAIGNGVADDVIPIQNAINYARDNGLVLRLSPVSYRITNTLVNQYDGLYKPLKINAQGATLLCDTKNKTALNLTGGYALTEITDLTLKYVGSDINADVLTNAIVATNVRCYLQNVRADGFLCDGFQFSSTAPNMNSSYWGKVRSDNNKRYGFYISGTDDNISVTKGELYCENNGYSGIYVTDDCMLRDAELFIYAENNCQSNQTKAGVYLGKIRNSRLTIYSEQTNSAEEIRFGLNSSDNQLYSFRNNKDYFSGTNTGYRGNRVYQQDASRASTPIVLRADYARAGNDGEYVKIDFEGVNISYGSVKGENDGIYLANAANKIGVTADRVKINTTQPALINGALQLNGDGSVATYINGDLAFRQTTGSNLYFDLATGSASHGGFKIRSSNAYATRFEVKSEGQINLGPLSSPPTSSSAGDLWYNSNTGKFQGHEGGAKNFLTTYSSGLGVITLVSGVGSATVTGLTSTDKAFVQLVTTSGTLGTHYKAVCSANTITITSINTSGATVTTDNSTVNYIIVK